MAKIPVPAFLENILTSAGGILEGALEKLNELFEKQKKTIMTVFGVLVVVLCLLIGVRFLQQHLEKEHAETARINAMNRTIQETAEKPSIPIEEIFLPDEPDFLPEVMLDREPEKWTAEDTRGFWTNPLEHEHIDWRENITNAVNDIMANIP